MTKLDDLTMTVNGPMVAVRWREADGNYLHFWLATERDPKDHNVCAPVRPFQIKCERRMGRSQPERTIYRNLPEEKRQRHGNNNTRYLNAEAKAWQPVVAEALRRVEAEGFYEAALAERATKDAEADARRKSARVGTIREGLQKLADDADAPANAVERAKDLLHHDDDVLLALSRAF